MYGVLTTVLLLSFSNGLIAEEQQVKTSVDSEPHREEKNLFSDGPFISNPIFSWPFDTNNQKADADNMQGRFFKVVQGATSKAVTPLESMLNTMKRAIPKCIDNLERIVDAYEKWVENHEGVTEFDVRIFADQFQMITQDVNSVFAAGIARINREAQYGAVTTTQGPDVTVASIL